MAGLWLGETMEGGRFELPLDVGTQAIAILAKRGAGKSWTAGVLEEELAKAGYPFVVLDPVGVHWGLRSSVDGRKESAYPVVVFGGEHGDLLIARNQGAQVALAIVEENISAIIDLTQLSKTAWREFVRDFCRELYRVNRTPRHVIIEEATEFVPQTRRPEMWEAFEAVERLARLGRNRGLGCTIISQRSAQVAKDVLHGMDVLIALRTVGKHDRDALLDMFGAVLEESQLPALEVFKRDIVRLEDGEAFVWWPTGSVFERVKIRSRETFHAGATPDFAAPTVVQARPDVSALRARLLPPEELKEGAGKIAVKSAATDDKRVKALESELADARAVVSEARRVTQEAKLQIEGLETKLAAARGRAAAAEELRTAFTHFLGVSEGVVGASAGEVDLDALVAQVAARLPARNGSGPAVTLAPAPVLRKKYLELAAQRLYERVGGATSSMRQAMEYLLGQGTFCSVNKVTEALSGVGSGGKVSGGNRDRWKKELDALVTLGLAERGGSGRTEYRADIEGGVAGELSAHVPDAEEIAQVAGKVAHLLAAAGVS